MSVGSSFANSLLQPYRCKTDARRARTEFLQDSWEARW
jgi:hypothetical protein